MKLKSLRFLESLSKKLKKKKKKVVLCHGDFDFLHLGHIKHFRAYPYEFWFNDRVYKFEFN